MVIWKAQTPKMIVAAINGTKNSMTPLIFSGLSIEIKFKAKKIRT